MRALILLAVLMGLAAPAQAQDISTIERARAAAERLNALTHAPKAMADGGSAPAAPAVGLYAPAEIAAASAGWNSYTMGVCIAAVVGGEQYVAVILNDSSVFVTQSTYAIPVIAANCASGKTFWLFFEADRTTVSAIASYPR